jgi:hypothetical protein
LPATEGTRTSALGFVSLTIWPTVLIFLRWVQQ